MTVNSPKTKCHGNSAQVVVTVRRCEIDHAQSWSTTSPAPSPRLDFGVSPNCASGLRPVTLRMAVHAHSEDATKKAPPSSYLVVR